MYIFLLILLWVLVALYYRRQYGYLLNTNFFVTSMWVICILIAYWNPLDLIPVGETVLLYSLLFLIAYNLIGAFYKYPSLNNIIGRELTPNSYDKLWKRTVFLSLIATVAYSMLLYKGITAFLTGDYALVKELFYEEGVSYFYMYFAKVIPLGMFRCLTISSLFFYFRGGGKKFLIMSIVLMLLTTLSSMTRVDMIVFIVTYFYLSAIYFPYKHINLKPFIIGVGLMAVVSVVFRGNDFTESLITYLSGSYSFFQYILDHPESYDLGNLQYGYMTFASLTEPFMLAMKVLGVTTAKTPEYLFNVNCQEFVNISNYDVVMYNNNTTALYIFLYDFGALGVILGGLLLGFLSSRLYISFTKNKIWLSILLLYVVVGLFTTTMSYNRFFGLMPMTVLFTSFLLTRKIKC